MSKRTPIMFTATAIGFLAGGAGMAMPESLQIPSIAGFAVIGTALGIVVGHFVSNAMGYTMDHPDGQ